jgi:hypothetical protein
MSAYLAAASLPCPAAATGTADSARPHVFWASQPVGPDQTVLAATGGTETGAQVDVARLGDGEAGAPQATSLAPLAWRAATVLQSSTTSVKFVVPADWAQGVYAFRVHNGGAVSDPVLLNVPDPWFIQGDQGESAAPGGWLQVHGTALALPGAAPRLALVRDGKRVADLRPEAGGNGFAQRFRVPVDVASGRYEVYVHNGFGGPGAWTRFHTFVETAVDSVLIAPSERAPAVDVDVSSQPGSDDDARFASALGALGASGGGVLHVPAGSFTLSRQLRLPDHTIVRGAGKTKSILRWARSPTEGDGGGAKQVSLVTGASIAKGRPDQGSFILEDLALVAAPDFVSYAVESAFSKGRGGLARVAVVLSNIGVFDDKKGRQPTALFLRQRSNFDVVDSDLDAANDIFARDGVSFLRIENNRLNWTESNIVLSGRSNDFIITGNTFNLRGTGESNGWLEVARHQKGTTPNPGFWFTDFGGTNLVGAAMSGPYVRDLYFANNHSTRDKAELPPSYAGLTFDGGDGIYLGRVASISGTTLALQGATRAPPASNGSYDWRGGIAQIVDGRGTGQWRYLVHAAAGASSVEVDRPWDIEPDDHSIVSLANLQGRVLMVDNDFAQEQTNQSYFFTIDVIKSNNRYGVEGAVAGDLTWLGKHYNGLSPGWHLQLLDNQVVRGNGSYFKSGVFAKTDGYAGASGAYAVIRNNRAPAQVPTGISITSKAGRFADAVIEGNAVATIDLGPKATDPIDASGIVLRHNSARWVGNLAGRSPGGDDVLLTLP